MGKFEGASPLQEQSFPLSFEGEGDIGGEVDNLMTEYAIVLYVTGVQDVGRG